MINIKDYFKSSSELILKLHTHGKEITAICNEILKCKKKQTAKGKSQKKVKRQSAESKRQMARGKRQNAK